MFQSVELSATGEALNGAGVMGLGGARLTAAAAAATAVIRETDGAGRVLMRLSAAANLTDECMPSRPVAYHTKVHVTLTGAGAFISLFH